MPYLPNLKACKSYDLQAFYFDFFCGDRRFVFELLNQKNISKKIEMFWFDLWSRRESN